MKRGKVRGEIVAFILGVLFLALIGIVALGGYFCVALGHMADVLQSPASTTNNTIDELVITTNSANITLHGLSAEANSKIVDFLILAGAK